MASGKGKDSTRHGGRKAIEKIREVVWVGKSVLMTKEIGSRKDGAVERRIL